MFFFPVATTKEKALHCIVSARALCVVTNKL